MKIGIISDTHRNRDYLLAVVDHLTKKERINTLYHLGDDWDDVTEFAGRVVDVLQVPGTYDPKYRDGSAPVKIFETIQGITILLVHTAEKDLKPEDLIKADIILSGHTHTAEIRFDDKVLYINPGHLKGARDRNMPPSYAILTIGDTEIEAKIYSLEHKALHSIVLDRTGTGFQKRYQS